MNFRILIAILCALITWPLIGPIQTLIYILGWITVPIAVLAGAYKSVPRPGLIDGNGQPRVDHHFTWPFMYVWDNWEDGIAAGRQYYDAGPVWKQIIYWTCIRNPANNMRTTPIISCKIKPERVGYVGGPHAIAQQFDKRPATSEWFFAWCGVYTGLWLQFGMAGSIYRFWVGWKIFPGDVTRTNFGYRERGAGFTMQLKRVASIISNKRGE